MARITVEDCLDKVDSRFALVILVAKRAKQLIKGDDCTITAPGNKTVVSALREVAAGNVSYDSSFSENSMLTEVERELTR